MVKFYDVEVEYWELTASTAVVQAESEEQAVERATEFFRNFTRDLEILSVSDSLVTDEKIKAEKEKTRPNLKIVN